MENNTVQDLLTLQSNTSAILVDCDVVQYNRVLAKHTLVHPLQFKLTEVVIANIQPDKYQTPNACTVDIALETEHVNALKEIITALKIYDSTNSMNLCITELMTCACSLDKIATMTQQYTDYRGFRANVEVSLKYILSRKQYNSVTLSPVYEVLSLSLV